MQIRYAKKIKDASAIGIIGSADGPTSIFVSKEINPLHIVAIIGGVALVAILIIFAVKKKKN